MDFRDFTAGNGNGCIVGNKSVAAFGKRFYIVQSKLLTGVIQIGVIGTDTIFGDR